MKFEEDNDFNELVSNFKKLSIIEKQRVTISEIKSLIATLSILNSQNNSHFKMLFNREIIDINEDNYDDDDFVEAIYVYLYSIKEALADLILNSNNNL